MEMYHTLHKLWLVCSFNLAVQLVMHLQKLPSKAFSAGTSVINNNRFPVVVTKAGRACCKLAFKTPEDAKEERQEMTKESSILVAVATGRHFHIKRDTKNSTKGWKQKQLVSFAALISVVKMNYYIKMHNTHPLRVYRYIYVKMGPHFLSVCSPVLSRFK